MTSLALVPYTFSLSKLPFIALQNVADYLNPFEIYHFSRISKRCRKLSRVFSKKATRIYLCSPYRVLIDFKERGYWSFEPRNEPGPDSYTVDRRQQPIYGYLAKKPASEVLKVLERVMNVFKNTTIHLSFNTLSSSRQELISYFNWFMENPSEVFYASLECDNGTDIQFLLENYKKPTEILSLHIRPEKIVHLLDIRKRLELPTNLETNLFTKVKICNNKLANLNLYNMFSSPVLESIETRLTNQELNTFLKNWQSGLTNSNWKSVCITTTQLVNLKDVLKDITAIYRDPRTVKRQVSVEKESFWIFGGIDIQKHDGTSTATIQWKDYKVENEDSEVPDKLTEEYERYIERGEVQPIEEEQDGIMQALFVFDSFCMYIW